MNGQEGVSVVTIRILDERVATSFRALHEIPYLRQENPVPLLSEKESKYR